LWIWLVLGFPLLVLAYRKGRQALRILLGAGYAVTTFGGIVILAVMAVAIPAPQNSYYLSIEDGKMVHYYWDKLEPGAQILDSIPEQAITVFGRASHARPWFFDTFADYRALVANPDPFEAARAGYSYIYMTNRWWSSLSPAQQQAFDNDCVHMMVTGDEQLDHLRWLYDIRQCGP
jgi:hypothetical protein